MLISEYTILKNVDPILRIIAEACGHFETSREIRKGIYEIGHFGSSSFLKGYEQYPGLSINAYGVCDSVEQILAACPELENSDRKFVVTVTPIIRDQEPKQGGWRWHKWGPYIGTKKPQHEYLCDETDIDKVLVFHIYEKV